MFKYTPKGISNATMDTKISGYIRSGKPSFWSEGPWLKLFSYNIMFNKYGWNHFRNLNKKYHATKTLDFAFNGDKGEYDMFARMYSQEIKKNTCPYWEWWGYELSKETKAICENLPSICHDSNTNIPCLLQHYEDLAGKIFK